MAHGPSSYPATHGVCDTCRPLAVPGCWFYLFSERGAKKQTKIGLHECVLSVYFTMYTTTVREGKLMCAVCE